MAEKKNARNVVDYDKPVEGLPSTDLRLTRNS